MSVLWLIVALVLAVVLTPVMYFVFQIARGWYKGTYAVLSSPHVVTPPATSILGHVSYLTPFKDSFLKYKDMHKMFGPTIAMRLGHVVLVFVSSQEDIEEILGRGSRHFHKTPIMHRSMGWLVPDSLILAEGEVWQTQRKTLNPAFHFQNLLAFHKPIMRKTGELLSLLQRQTEKPLDVSSLFPLLTMDIISLFGFGFDLGTLTSDSTQYRDAMIAMFLQSQENATRMFPTWMYPQSRKTRESVQLVKAKMIEVLQKRKRDGLDDEEKDVMAILMRAEQAGEKWVTPDIIMQEMLLFFAAGTDTTSITFSALFFNLAHDKEVQRKLQDEIDRELKGETPSYENTKSLPYLNAVINETLRLFPPAPIIGRSPDSTITLPSGLLVNRDVALVISPWYLHRCDAWGVDADQFRPERWLEGKAPPYCFLPFTLGARNCIGQSLAMLELRLITAALIQKLSFTLAPTMPVPLPISRAVTLCFPSGVWLVPHLREGRASSSS